MMMRSLSLHGRAVAGLVLAVGLMAGGIGLTAPTAHADTPAGSTLELARGSGNSNVYSAITTGTISDFAPSNLNYLGYTNTKLVCPTGYTDSPVWFLAPDGQAQPTVSDPHITTAASIWPRFYAAGTFDANGNLAMDPSAALFNTLWFDRTSGSTVQADLTSYLANGTYDLGIACRSATGSTNGNIALDASSKPVAVWGKLVVTGSNWTFTPPAVTAAPAATTTSLTVDKSSVVAGSAVSVTATVSPAAAGSVEFLNGTTSLGTAPTDAATGVATLSVSSLPVGTASLTAVFTPTDATKFQASTSAAVSVTVTAPAGAPSVKGPVTFNVPTPNAGSLTLTGTVTADLGTLVQQADGSFATANSGLMGDVTVTDNRYAKAAWSLTGVADAFTGPAALTASALGWTPAASTGATLPSNVTLGGAAAAGATGLASSQTLASATASTDQFGTFTSKVNAKLDVKTPVGQKDGSYSTQLTLTLI